MSTDLPLPSADALALSDRLVMHLRRYIAAQGGWISFADYMEHVLYAPGLGYYSNGARKFGPEGDFVTAPELGGLFAACVARQSQAWLNAGLPDVLEIGPGSGQLAFDLLNECAALGCAPRRYFLLERSGDLRQRQQALLATLPQDLRERIEWLDALPSAFEGVVLANEVLDALPAFRIGWRETGLIEQGVSWSDDIGLHWSDRPLENVELRNSACGLRVPTPYTSEMSLAAPAWVASVLESCQRAALLFIDYGYGRREFYHPQRNEGTLTGFYRHRRLNDPFVYPGLVDLTAHVDFTSIADATLDNGGILLGYTTQAAFLLDCGLSDRLKNIDPRSREYLRLAQEAQRLTHPAEMGELFKVMAIGKAIDEPGPGFMSPGREYQLDPD